MRIGTVTFYNEARGFGFIRPDDGGADVFVHLSAFTRSGLPTPMEGQRVSFDIELNHRNGKPSATNIRAEAGPPPCGP
jgi:CspA family cold shock protein